MIRTSTPSRRASRPLVLAGALVAVVVAAVVSVCIGGMQTSPAQVLAAFFAPTGSDADVAIMGLRVPWRSDCVVQALAARRWLARGGVDSDVCIGVRNDAQGFQAHAWLKVGERIVTGGDVSSYAELPPARLHRDLFAR